MSAIDFEEQQTVSNDQLKEISELAFQQVKLEDTIATQERLIKDLKAQHKKLSTDTLPTAMQAAGMVNFALTDGSEVSVKEELFMSIPKKNKAEAADWLVAHDHESLVKNDVYLPFSKGDDEQLNNLIEILKDNGYSDSYSIEQGMNTASVKAAVREMLEQGVDVPMKLFGGFQQITAKVKLPK